MIPVVILKRLKLILGDIYCHHANLKTFIKDNNYFVGCGKEFCLRQPFEVVLKGHERFFFNMNLEPIPPGICFEESVGSFVLFFRASIGAAPATIFGTKQPVCVQPGKSSDAIAETSFTVE